MSERPHRVLWVHRDLPFHGGITRSFLSVAKHLDRNLVAPAVASLEPVPPESLDLFSAAGIPVHAMGRGVLRQAGGLRRAIEELGSELVCCASFRAYALAKLAQRRACFRTLFWVRGIPIMESRWKRRLFRRWARRDTLLAISQAALDAHSYPAHTGRRIVSYNGVAPAPASAANPADRARARAEMGLHEDETAIGYVAEFTDWKEHATLLKAFGKLAAERPSLRLVLAGTGAEEGALRRQAAPLGERVRFLGARPDVRRLMAGLDVYAHPARAEAFGRAVVEAMLAEVPVIAACAGAIPELIESERTGMLFAASDVDSLAEVLAGILDNPAASCIMAKDAARVAAERFGEERAAREFEAVVRDEFEARVGE